MKSFVVPILALSLLISVRLSAALDSRMSNVSIRGKVGAGENTLIIGFVVQDKASPVLVRAIGPSLAAFGISNPLADPQIAVYDAKGTIVARGLSVESLEFTPHEEMINIWDHAGAFPIVGSTKDSVLFTGLLPGAYTIHITSASGSSGVVLGEVYTIVYDVPYAPIQG